MLKTLCSDLVSCVGGGPSHRRVSNNVAHQRHLGFEAMVTLPAVLLWQTEVKIVFPRLAAVGQQAGPALKCSSFGRGLLLYRCLDNPICSFVTCGLGLGVYREGHSSAQLSVRGKKIRKRTFLILN